MNQVRSNHKSRDRLERFDYTTGVAPPKCSDPPTEEAVPLSRQWLGAYNVLCLLLIPLFFPWASRDSKFFVLTISGPRHQSGGLRRLS